LQMREARRCASPINAPIPPPIIPSLILFILTSFIFY
jgi:hypothetical protein